MSYNSTPTSAAVGTDTYHEMSRTMVSTRVQGILRLSCDIQLGRQFLAQRVGAWGVCERTGVSTAQQAQQRAGRVPAARRLRRLTSGLDVWAMPGGGCCRRVAGAALGPGGRRACCAACCSQRSTHPAALRCAQALYKLRVRHGVGRLHVPGLDQRLSRQRQSAVAVGLLRGRIGGMSAAAEQGYAQCTQQHQALKRYLPDALQGVCVW